MSDDADFRRATRRVLFPNPQPVQDIPGAGTSAAEESEKHVKIKVTINLDGDVVNHFKERAREEGLPYQLLINQTLRSYMLGERPERLAKEVSKLLEDDPNFIAKLAQAVRADKG